MTRHIFALSHTDALHPGADAHGAYVAPSSRSAVGGGFFFRRCKGNQKARP